MKTSDFRPFFVDLGVEAVALDGSLTPGRYLVISVVCAHNSTFPGIIAEFVAYRIDDQRKRITKFAVGVANFVGFVGDCIMCDQRKPQEGA